MVQVSQPHMITGKIIALTIQTFVTKVMSLFLTGYHVCHSFSSSEQASLNLMAAVTICSDFGAQENQSVAVSIVSPSICHEVMGLVAMILVF